MRSEKFRFGGSLSPTVDVTDEEFLQRLDWRKSADSPLKTAAETGDPHSFAGVLSGTLRKAKRSRRIKPTTPPLLQPLWSRHAFVDADDSDHGAGALLKLNRLIESGKSPAKLKAGLSKLVENELVPSLRLQSVPLPLLHEVVSKPGGRGSRRAETLDTHLTSAAQRELHPPKTHSIDFLKLLHGITVLTELGAELSARSLFALWRAVLEASLAMELGPESASVETDDRGGSDDRHLLLAGELPWRIGLCFHDLRGAGTLRKAGRSCLRNGLEVLTDGDGTPHARSLRRLPLTLAVFVRSTFAGEVADESLWGARSAERFESLISRTAALCHADGRIPLSNGASFAPASLLRAASQMAGLSKREPSAQRLLSLPDDSPTSGKRHRNRPPRVVRRNRLPSFDSSESPSSQSDWAELACLRNNWLMGADSCVITHHQPRPQISVTAFERVLIDGEWQSDVLLDGQPVDHHQQWDCVCWFSDKDLDYLELQQNAEGVTLFRQVMLSRTDHWLLLADCAIAPQGETIELTTRLPLAEDVTADAARWTRELSLSRHNLKATVSPLGLDQERVVHTHGSLQVQDGELRLQQSVKGTAVYAPLVIDWSPDRRRSQPQWRRLTVAEDGSALGRDVAAGFRLRIGKHQWLFYRSLKAGETSRTVLGHHTPHETVIAEFTADGNVEPLVMVE